MKKINKKQKLIVITILVISILSIFYYAYEKNGTFAAEENLEILDSKEKNENTDTKEKSGSDDTKEAEEKSKEADNKVTIKIHITGAVNNEGLIELEEGSRMADAIEKAGGLKDNACMEEVNLALALEDGIKVTIPTKEEVEKQKKESLENSNYSAEQKNITSEKTSNQTQNNTSKTIVSIEKSSNVNSKININTAKQTELETLPGIGAATALKIINYRNENGKFKSIDDIKKVSGIGDAKFSKLKELINV